MLLHVLRLFFAVLAIAAAAPAQAQVTFDLQHFAPARHGEALITVESGAISQSLQLPSSVFVNYAYRPLRVSQTDGSRSYGVVDHRFDLLLSGSVAMWGRLSLAVQVPATLLQRGSLELFSRTSLSAMSFGDLRLSPKVGLLNADRFFVDVAAQAIVTVPTGNESGFSGDRFFSVAGELDISRKLGAFTLGANLGYLWRANTRMLDLQIGPELYYRAGVGFNAQHYLARVPLEIIGEVFGRTSASRQMGALQSSPMEWLVGVRYSPTVWLQLSVGGGRGIIPGYGAPDARAFFGISIAPIRKSADGPIIAAQPAPEPVRPPVVQPAMPAEATLANAIKPLDQDGDGINDDNDACDGEAEVLNGIDDGDGCPDGKGIVEAITNGTMSLRDKIRFAPGSDVLLARSRPVLKALAVFLNGKPGITKLIVEGHTDAIGEGKENWLLSQRRAEAVVAYLIRAGVARERLRAVGYGESRPIASNKNRRGKEANRRVDFTVAEQTTSAQNASFQGEATMVLR